MKKLIILFIALCLPLVFIWLNTTPVYFNMINIGPYISIAIWIFVIALAIKGIFNDPEVEREPLTWRPPPQRNVYMRCLAYNLLNGAKALYAGSDSYNRNEMAVAIKSAEYYIKKAKEDLSAYDKSISNSSTIQEPLCKLDQS